MRRHNPAGSLLLGALCALAVSQATAELHVGVGIHDATGPTNDVVLMGMANPSQKGEGLHFRLRSRAFIAFDTTTKRRFAQVSLDAGMSGIILKKRVVAALAARFNDTTLYTDQNVGISGTHTHSGPSGFLQNIIFQFAGSFWQPQTIGAMVDGVVASIVQAHGRLAPARAFLGAGRVAGANINRSPTAYLRNSQAERDAYPDGDTDKLMDQLTLTSTDGEALGVFNWFAVHPTSMNNTNKLVSGDNKGYASYLLERQQNGGTADGVPPGSGPFVAAFMSTNLGDVSPNTQGPHCRDTGLPCDNPTSTCNGKVEQCSSSGPGKDMFESTEIIATKQADVASALLHQALAGKGAQIKDPQVDFIHAYVKMPGLVVRDNPARPGYAGHLCSAAMGDAFAAGTTDGPGMFNFEQGNSSKPFWNVIGSVLHKASKEQKACQAPKSILLDTGNIKIPHAWAPDVVPLQLFRLGQLVIVNIPTELTTMAGRRLKKALKATLVEQGVLDAEGTVVISGLSNGYADYTTTFEEYQEQRYEGGSTIFGPLQLNGYIQEFLRLAVAMAQHKAVDPGPMPDDFSAKLGKGKQPKAESPPKNGAFGDVSADVRAGAYTAGQDAVEVTFVGGVPNNDMREDGTFLEVQRQATGGEWQTVAVDGDVETRFHSVAHKCGLLSSCKYHDATVQWYPVAQTPPGTYRIVHYGAYYSKPALKKGKFVQYTGTSSTFEVVAPASTPVAAAVGHAITTCSDNGPDSHSCADQKKWGKCSASFMKGYCCQSCHNCDPSCTGGGPPAPSPKPGPTCSDVGPDSNSCANQKLWGKCSASFMKGYCCQSCHNCDPSCTRGPPAPSPKPPSPAPQGTWSGHATHYNAGQAGNPPCGGATSGMVCAPSDVGSMWKSLGAGGCGPVQGSGCTCDSGHNCPKCNDLGSACGQKVQIWCTGSSYCKSGSIVVAINNACPHTHPCNIGHHVCTTSGDPDHIDISDTAYFKLASGQPSAIGLPITYSLTSMDTGVYDRDGKLIMTEEEVIAEYEYAHNRTLSASGKQQMMS